MNQVNELLGMLNQHFKWNKVRMDCFTGVLVGLMRIRSMNLIKIEMVLPSEASSDSGYRHMQRFIHDYSIDVDVVALFIMTLFKFASTGIYLTMDRTNWKLSKKDIYLSLKCPVSLDQNTLNVVR